MEGELPGCPTLMLLALCEYHVTGVGKCHISHAEGGLYLPHGRNASLRLPGEDRQ